MGIGIHVWMKTSQGNFLCFEIFISNNKKLCFSFYLLSFFLYKIREQEAGTSPARGMRVANWFQWRGAGKGGRRVNMVQIL
jgi:hypothetical protein